MDIMVTVLEETPPFPKFHPGQPETQEGAGDGWRDPTSNNPSREVELLNKCVCKNNGVLFENQLLQIGVKSEFRLNLGHMHLFYGNKILVQFQNFMPTIIHSGDPQT
ncbi:LOW QUALITY PROTEIN: hypothetical protein QTO34_002255 [Cnephaeus nilssonii]|uniref:Clathrin adaptor alpha/beta/gamma-adaptin appendage Ig-like subdomain domain-containing protein n=1 Tax=Cnephaeus nilssonii TaxID=3371016 RepID=A0AA40LML3_CNENI|nr:LOW QUALITY PROTEIN: hypothetical protein QTO34_002255 [Eptesicus nilssonii]